MLTVLINLRRETFRGKHLPDHSMAFIIIEHRYPFGTLACHGFGQDCLATVLLFPGGQIPESVIMGDTFYPMALGI